MSDTEYSRKQVLECLRLASDSMQLAGDVRNPALQSQFLRMGKLWTNLADKAARTEH
jgi:hypothetical protein